MSYYGNYATLIEKQRQEDNEKKKQQLINKIRAQQERFRRRHKRVYRGPGKNVTEGEANEYMTFMKEYYAERALREEKNRGEKFTLPISYHTFQKKKSQKKFGKIKKKSRIKNHQLINLQQHYVKIEKTKNQLMQKVKF